jgi:Flp pilus assembly protein TadG
MPGLNKNRRQDETHRLRPFAALRRFARRFAGDKRANVLIMFGLMLPLLLAIVAGGIDFSYAQGAKNALQDAADAASLAVSAEVVLHPNDTVAQLQAVAAAALAADDRNGAVTITTFQVCAPVAQSSNCSGGLSNNTVLVAVQASATCIPVPIPTMVCQGSPPAMLVSASTTTVIGFGATLQLNVVMDTSASMIVGATPDDVQGIINWTGATTTTTSHGVTTTTYTNWAKIKPNDPPPFNTGGNDNPPCAFACHDIDSATTPADVAQGLVNAHLAVNPTSAQPVETRFDVMISAAQALVNHVQTLSQSTTTLAKNTYVFNIYSFDTSIRQFGSSNIGFQPALTAVSQVSPGLDTYLDNAMSTFAGTGQYSIGANGTGASTASPLKFMILVTDGLQSDRTLDWQSCTSRKTDVLWGNFPQACFAGGFAAPLNTANCTKLKNEGVVLAVLETPYVPLTGQDPHNVPYEGNVRHTIYPGGPGTPSTVSTALAACATTGYYFQAVNSSDIATGFTTLTDKFLQHSARILQ